MMDWVGAKAPMSTQQTPALTISTIGLPEVDEAVALICLAFSSDPAARWTYPNPHAYLSYFPRIVRAFGGKAFAHGTGYQVSGFRGAALWLPPGVHPDQEALAAIMQESLPADRFEEVTSVFERMGAYHPAEPHWYLPMIGVDPAHQGRGYGSALLQHGLLQCDKAHVPAYLESSNPANVPLYARHDFVVLGTIQVGSSPTIIPMLRAAR
jgi:ribosomal protein S18 acetylase RimI-like enzyme